MLPQQGTDEEEEDFSNTCFDSSGSGFDLYFVGPVDEMGNAIEFSSSDGTCTDPLLTGGTSVTIVESSSQGDASGDCFNFGGGGAVNLPGSGYDAPDDYYVCS
jgi:hypothetical protein